MIEKQITKEEIDQIIEFLMRQDLFRHLKKSYLKELAASMKMITYEGGETVIRQGETTSAMYLVFQGILRVFHSEGILSELAPGQIFGEMALLSHKPKTAAVVACRDSIVLKLDEQVYNQFEQNHPNIALDICKQAIKRLVDGKRKREYLEPDIKTMAVVPAGDSEHREFARYLQKALGSIKPTLIVTKELCNQRFGINVAQEDIAEQHHAQISAWLQSLEGEYGYLIFESDRQMTPWTKRCLRQADRILLVAEENVYPAQNSIEMNLWSKDWQFHSPIELVFLHAGPLVTGSSLWLKSRSVQGVHHMQIDSENDKAKFIRFLTGQSIGVILTGGGARGFAHLGFLKAMEEKHIPIDYIAGTSMGALVAAGVALGMTFAEINDFAHHFAYRSQYTLPLVALTTGRYLTEMLQSLCGDIMIEDLKTRYFCVAANVTESKLRVLDSGRMWWAIRATVSVPGIFPPIYDEAGNMLVDGGILNNMPLDILRRKMFRGKVICARCFAKEERFSKRFITETWISGWKLLLQKVIPFYKRSAEYNSMSNIILESMSVAAKTFEKTVVDQADYLLQFDTSAYHFLQFEKVDEIADIGYRASMEKLPLL